MNGSGEENRVRGGQWVMGERRRMGNGCKEENGWIAERRIGLVRGWVERLDLVGLLAWAGNRG